MPAVVRTGGPGRPVARHIGPALWRISILVLLLAAVGVALMVSANAALAHRTSEVAPALDAQRDYVADLNRVQDAVQVYAVRGSAANRRAYDDARSDLVAGSRRLAREGSGPDGVDGPATEQLDLARQWLSQYADPRVHPRGGGAAPAASLGRVLFGRVLDQVVVTDRALAAAGDDADDAAVLRYRLAIAATLVLVGLTWLWVGRERTRLLAQLSAPLQGLEKVAQRMLRNDPEGRADADHGPTEARSIARALNDFADAQRRARAAEGRFREELHVLDSAKDDFVSNVSHELRTPLTTISGYLELVAEEFEGRFEPRHERMLEASRRNVDRLRSLIDDLLALSKAESRASEYDAADIGALVLDAVTDIRITAARRGIAVEPITPPEPVLVVGDRAMLYRAFLNVLTNAVKFSHDGGVVEVAVSALDDGLVEVAVRDHGIGIPRAELDRLGTRFFRASNAMSHEIAGTGLGLRIVQTIIDKHAGDVVIESSEGEGTTVFVRLRRDPECAPVPHC